MNDSKPTNPKDQAATDRVPLGLCSPIAKAHWAAAQHAGLCKYGAWNWRVAGVRASVYVHAIERHLDAWMSGETVDPIDGTQHLGNIMACAAILLDAQAAGKLTDDRPPSIDIRATYTQVEDILRASRERYADRKPIHYTIAEGVPLPTPDAPADADAARYYEGPDTTAGAQPGFKVGDRVRVSDSCTLILTRGREGKVVEDDGSCMPYRVLLDGGVTAGWWFAPYELKPVGA